jgi:sterol desaturase/sphingolipid hydroxylase (fatty acid hydroxylase superfamily)
MLLIPLMREFHFYCIHRLIHVPALYRKVHHLHHNNVNPGPWSGLSMHPIEHLLYFSGVLIHWILPSHPVHALFHLIHAGLSPVPGHTGFEKVVVGKEGAIDTHCLAHYLHHKYSSPTMPTARFRSISGSARSTTVPTRRTRP